VKLCSFILLIVIMLIFVMLSMPSFIILAYYAVCRYAEGCYAECNKRFFVKLCVILSLVAPYTHSKFSY
jgi:hypothetical protein